MLICANCKGKQNIRNSLGSFECSCGKCDMIDIEPSICNICLGLGMVEDFDGYGYQLFKCAKCNGIGSITA